MVVVAAAAAAATEMDACPDDQSRGGKETQRQMSDRQEREERAGRAGRAWAAAVRLRLHQDGRRASGGWPGTITEARAQVESAIGRGTVVTQEERSHLVRILYDSAKDCWLVNREPQLQDE